MNTTNIDQVPTVMRLAQIWNLIAESPLQPKQYGQLKCLRNKCGPDTQHIIEFVLHGWPEFTDCVTQQTGYKSVPPLPHVGFLLKFYMIAVAMIADDRENLDLVQRKIRQVAIDCRSRWE